MPSQLPFFFPAHFPCLRCHLQKENLKNSQSSDKQSKVAKKMGSTVLKISTHSLTNASVKRVVRVLIS